jgi:secreted trypsin-like serine protease
VHRHLSRPIHPITMAAVGTQRRTVRSLLVAFAVALAACGDTTVPTSPAAAPVTPRTIINGTSVTATDFAQSWPFIAGLLRVNTNGSADLFCTGSVVASRWVITAAHCVEGLVASNLAVAVGDPDISSGRARAISVTEIRIHPGFRSNLLNDVALLKLASDAGVTPAQLPSVDVTGGQSVRLAGFGLTQNGGSMSPQLQSTTLRVANYDPGLAFLLTRTHFWAEALGTSACSGDSGGPAINAAGEIVGLTSFGTIPCGFGSGHTSVARVKEFILDVLYPDRKAPQFFAESVSLTPDVVLVGATATMIASATDEYTGNSNIAGMEVSLDGVTWAPMTSDDGAFDSAAETARGTLTSSTTGTFSACVRVVDAAGNTSEPTCRELIVYEPISGIAIGNGKYRNVYYYDGQAYPEEVELRFSADYRPGSSAPSGSASLRFFEVGNRTPGTFMTSTHLSFLRFNGTDEAEFQGEGTVTLPSLDSTFPITFRIWANGKTQTIRIKLWSVPEQAWYELPTAVAMTSGRLVVKSAAGK